HVGWALMVAIGLIAATRSRLRWLWLLHPLLTLFVVVGTANHYWLDAIVAVVLLGVTLAFLRAPATATAPVCRGSLVVRSSVPPSEPEPADPLAAAGAVPGAVR
ncbi:phosphatase PAP2 family protein, partial [Streptomyces sp. NPDC087850]